jgi:energy-coupling factor transporter ATP-binding protein EcfA2
LRLAWVARTPPEQVRLGGLAFLDAVRRIDEPCDLSFRIGSDGHRLEAGLVVQGVDSKATLRLARTFMRLAGATLPFYGLEVVPIAAVPSIALPEARAWVSRLSNGRMKDEGVRAGGGSPLATALKDSKAVVSVAIGAADDEDGKPRAAADVIVASSEEPTTVLAALLPIELRTQEQVAIHHTTGAEADLILQGHGLPATEPISASALADLLSLPTRTRATAAWRGLPEPPSRSEDVMAALRDAPHQHRLIVGRSGTGKSTLVAHLALAAARTEKALCVIDPHGDLAVLLRDQLEASSEGRRLLYLDFAGEPPPTYNILQREPGQSKGNLIHETYDNMRGHWDSMSEEYFGPVFQRVWRWSVKVVLKFGRTKTLGECIRITAGDDEYIDELLADADDEDELVRMWRYEIRGFITNRKDNTQVWLTGKLDAFVSDPQVAKILDTPRSSFSIVEAIRKRRIMICRLPVGELGLSAVRVLATTIVSRAIGALGRRFSTSEARHPLALYIDEWQLVAQEPVHRILAEGRKYGFELTIANQTMGQIRDPARVIGNIGTIGCFRLGPAEAALLEPEFATMTVAGLRSLPNHHIAVRSALGSDVFGPTPPLPEPADDSNGDGARTTSSLSRGNARGLRPDAGSQGNESRTSRDGGAGG